MQVRRLDTSRPRDVRAFVEFPFRLYRDCALWVPPMVADMRRVLDRERHPFYQHSTAEFFVVESGGEIVGRVAVLDHRRFNTFRQQRTVFFYYLEMAEDPAIAQMLFSAGFDWARSRGLDTLIGPKGFLQADGQGLLVEGFEHRPAVGIAYNYPYYDAYVQACGLQPIADYLSGHLTNAQQLPQRFCDVAERAKQQRSFWVKSFASEHELREWVPQIGRLYNESFAEHWEFCPVTDAELKAITDRLISIADPRLIKLVMKGDDVIGFVFAFHDISEGLQKARGHLWPLGWYHLLRAFKRTKWVNFNGLGILPQHQGVGANAVLYTELVKTVLDFGFEHADVVQVGEYNLKSLGESRAVGVQWYKRHRIYTGSF